MKRICIVLLACVSLLSCRKDDGDQACTTQNLITARKAGQLVPDKYIVKFKDGIFDQLVHAASTYETRQSFFRTVAEQWLLSVVRQGKPGAVFTEVMQGFEVELDKASLEIIKHHPDVAVVEEVQVFSTFADCSTPTVNEVNSQVISYGATRVGSGNGSGKRVWVIDTGVDLDHPDLNVNVSLSRNFLNPRANADDDDGHGTHVAGIIAAKNNTFGTMGVAWNAQVIAIKVLDSLGEGSSTSVLQGIDYILALAQPGEVVNLSLGGGPSLLVDLSVQAAASKGLFFTIAAGNESEFASNHSPARAEGPTIFTLSAINDQDRFALFSNFGNPPVDYAEPGVSILSTYKDGTYRRISGTSMAAPHMAGILLLKGAGFRTDGTALGDPDGKPDRIAVAK